MHPVQRYAAFGAAAALAIAGFALGDYAVMAWLAAAVLACVGVLVLSTRWGTLAAALLGMSCSLYLFQMKLTPDKKSVCDVSATISCDIVNSSAASMMFGIPIALFGTGFFLGVALATGLLKPGPGNRLYQVVGGLSVVGTLYSIYLAATALQIGATCPMCMTIYACNALLLVAAFFGLRTEGTGPFDEPVEVLRSSSLLMIGVTFLLVVVLGQSYYQSQDLRTDAEKAIDELAGRKIEPAQPQPGHPEAQPEPRPQDDMATKLAELYVRPRGTMQLTGEEPILGDPNAPYTVVEYACFGCPHCAMAFGHIKQLVANVPEVKVKFRSFPLTSECNAAVPRSGRPEVCRAAMAAKCAGQQGKFWEFAELLFANQQQLGEPLLAAVVDRIGLDFGAFSSCMADEKVLAKVVADAESGASMQIMGTPTLFLQGVLDDGQWVEICGGADGVRALIEAKKQGIALRPGDAGLCPLE